MGDLLLCYRLSAHVGYTGRFVVGRGRRLSDGCGLHTCEVCGVPSLALGVGAFSGRVFALVILTSLKYCECLLVSSLIGELTEVPAF